LEGEALEFPVVQKGTIIAFPTTKLEKHGGILLGDYFQSQSRW